MLHYSHRMWYTFPRALALASVVALSGTYGCATVFTSRHDQLVVRSTPDSALVRTGSGRSLGPTPLVLHQRVRPERLRLERRFHAPADVHVSRRLKWVSFLNLINPIGWAVDLWSGAAWRYHAPEYSATMARLPIVLDSAGLLYAEQEVLRTMARIAVEGGCNPVVWQGWLDASDRIEAQPPSTPEEQTEVSRRIEQHVRDLGPELEALCAQRNPLLIALEEVQSTIEPRAEFPQEQIPDVVTDYGGGSTGDEPKTSEPKKGGQPTGGALSGSTGEPTGKGALGETAPPTDYATEQCRSEGLGYCITFAFGRSELTPTAIVALRELASRLLSAPLPTVLTIEGTADEVGSDAQNLTLGLRRAEAVGRLLHANGVSAADLRATSCGEEAACQLVPHATRAEVGAELNRRVRMSIRPRSPE